MLSIHLAATATNDIDLAIYIAPSRACILKPSICISGRRRNILNEKYRITYRIVEGVQNSQNYGVRVWTFYRTHKGINQRVWFGRPVPRQPARSQHPGWIWCLLTGLHFPFPLRFPLEPPCSIRLVPSLSDHAIASPMTFTTENQHRASSSGNPMDHTHYWCIRQLCASFLFSLLLHFYFLLFPSISIDVGATYGVL